jgi:hypothetical protein
MGFEKVVATHRPMQIADGFEKVVATHRPMGIEDAISLHRVAAISYRGLFPSKIHKQDGGWIRGHADFRPRRACDTAACLCDQGRGGSASLHSCTLLDRLYRA